MPLTTSDNRDRDNTDNRTATPISNAEPTISASSSSQLRPPSTAIEARRPSSSTNSIRAAYPSASEDYIGSYYYGRYDHELFDEAEAGPSSVPAGSSLRSPRSASPLPDQRSHTSAPQIAPQDFVHGVSLGFDDLADAHRHAPTDAAPSTSAHLTSWNRSIDIANSHDTPDQPPQHIILASPEELQRSDYFSTGTGSGKSRNSRHNSSFAPMSTAAWNASESDIETPVIGPRGQRGRTDPELDGLRYGQAKIEGRQDSQQKRAVGFMTTSPGEDIEDPPSEYYHRRRFSAEIMESAGGDTPAMRNAKNGINRFSKSLRRLSRRVVDMGHTAADNPDRASVGHIRLADDDPDSSGDDEEIQPITASPLPPQNSEPASGNAALGPLSLRGKSLGFLSPENRFRKGMAKLLSHWWVEPLILAVIVAHLVIVIILTGRDVAKAPRKPGYFDYWENAALLGIFCVYTVEVLARIVVSGLVINPPALYQSGSAKFATSDPNTAIPLEVAAESEPKMAFAASPPEHAKLEQEDRRRMSRSNTLDAWTELGGSIKTRAQQALNPETSLKSREKLNRQSTMGSMPLVSNHQRSGTIATFKSAAFSTAPSARVGSQQDSPTQEYPASQPPPYPPTPASRQMTQDWSKILRAMQEKAVPFASAIVVQRAQTTNYAYLRHSWNRVDFFSVCCFWISFFLAITRQDMVNDRHVYIFQALSILRCARLLTVTSGTSTILQSLKLAAPLLWNVLFFTLFAMILFSIIGIQSFKGSYRRNCVWVGDLNSGIDADPGQNYTTNQICGGWIDGNHVRQPHLTASGQLSPIGAKGYLCPIGQVCQEGDSNPNANSQSFDNIFTSLLEVVIVISSNGWSGVMYDMVDADYFAASIFFILGLIFLNFWLANLFVAVITNSFATISSQTHQSAFSKQNIDETIRNAAEQDAPETLARRRRKRAANVYKRVWGYTHFLWLGAIIVSLSFQASGASYDTSAATHFVETAETYLTIAFDVEIVMRFISYLLDDDWRSFFNGHHGGRNKVDLGLCIITSIIQIPVIKSSPVYPWLTIFQLQRFYRVIIAAPRMERLLLRVFGSLSGLLNMILFLLLMVGLAALVAVQLFRGDIADTNEDGESVEMTFKHLFNSFLAVYQVFSSENWNDVLFDVITNVKKFQQAVIAGIFVCGWFLFANFIVLQMFIAVINEGFSFSEAERRRQQLDHYLKRLDSQPQSTAGWLIYKLSPYRWLKDRNAAILNKSKDGSADSQTEATARSMDSSRATRSASRSRNKAKHGKFVAALLQVLDVTKDVIHHARVILRLDTPEEHSVPLDTVRQREIRNSLHGNEMLQNRMSTRQQSIYDTSPADDDDAARAFARERQLHRMRSNLGLNSEKPTQQQINDAHIARHEENPRIAMAKAINQHPSFDKALWLFSNHSKFRRFCQSIVPSAYGERIFGRQHSPRRFLIAQVLIFTSIVASVVVAGVAAPSYRKDWYARHGFRRTSWFSMAEVFLSLVFFVEFFVKIVADGFAFTPNAYVLSHWNLLDLLVLGTLVVNVSTELAVIGGVSRFTRAIKAFRALRLINLSARMRSTFENLVIGGGRFIDAAILAILYIIPFAVWGQNLFSGLLYGCTDDSSGISVKADCRGEYSASPGEWSFLAPRVWQNPTSGSSYSFDDFKSALLILFEIVSLEGWIDVMTSAMSIVGKNKQPQQDAMQVNALYFVVYNLIGAVFVLTLFVSVIIEGFQSATGAAFLSTDQRQWIDLKRLISRQRPSKRPAAKPTTWLRKWCHTRATRKHDWWGRMMTFLYIINLITLCTQSYDQELSAEQIRDFLYLVLALFYFADVVIRYLGLGWAAFRRSWWCIFDTLVVIGIFANTIPLLASRVPVQSNIQLQKVFLTAATLKLVSKHNGLNQLFKTAISGLPAIVSLLGLWLCFFFFFAIMFLEIFGLTKWGYIGPESYSKNFSSLPLTLVFLSMMSTGEGWNGYMHDYTVEPPSCTPSANYLETDCGSTGWAYFLFIGWNVTSMYIFLNMFTGTVVENFSYIFQLGGKPILGREDMRGFKKVWFQVAGTSTHMPQDKLAIFFSAVPGKFDLKMYPEELSVQSLRTAVTGDGRTASSIWSSSRPKGVAGAMSRLRAVSPLTPSAQSLAPWASTQAGESAGDITSGTLNDGLDLSNLHQLLSSVSREELQLRRERFNRIWHEACLIAEPEKGVSFHDMLTLIAHYKLVDDNAALAPQEFLDRRAMNERIDDRINLERVRGVMRMTYLRHRFLALQAERRRVDAADFARPFVGETLSSVGHATVSENVPIITVDDAQSPPLNAVRETRRKPHLKLNVADLGTAYQTSEDPHTPPGERGASPTHGYLRSTDHLSPFGTPSSRARPGEGTPSHADLLSALDGASGSGHGHSLEELERRASPLLDQFDDSAWGKFMRRVSVGRPATASSAGSGGDRSPRNEVSQRFQSSSSSSASPTKPWLSHAGRASSPASTGYAGRQFDGAESSSSPFFSHPGGIGSVTSLGDEHRVATAMTSNNPFYSLDSDDAWASTARRKTPSPLSSPTRRHRREESRNDTDEEDV